MIVRRRSNRARAPDLDSATTSNEVGGDPRSLQAEQAAAAPVSPVGIPAGDPDVVGARRTRWRRGAQRRLPPARSTAPLPADRAAEESAARLEAVDDNGSRAVHHPHADLATGTDSEPDAIVGRLLAGGGSAEAQGATTRRRSGRACRRIATPTRSPTGGSAPGHGVNCRTPRSPATSTRFTGARATPRAPSVFRQT